MDPIDRRDILELLGYAIVIVFCLASLAGGAYWLLTNYVVDY